MQSYRVYQPVDRYCKCDEEVVKIQIKESGFHGTAKVTRWVCQKMDPNDEMLKRKQCDQSNILHK
jgi:hypothetical protein